jgi:hypothetical protein
MAQSLSQKIGASSENPPRSCYEGNLDGCTCCRILGDFFHSRRRSGTMKAHDYSASPPNETSSTKTYLEPSEVESLRKSATNLRGRLLVRLLFHLGCCVSEPLALFSTWL